MGCNSMEKTKQKPKFKKGLWSPEEDEKLRNYILRHGHGCWSSVPINAGLQRNGKSCRLRWINYLRPGLKRGMFSSHEEEIILTLHRSLGNKWSQIAQHLPGRTDNEIKNFWHSNLKKKVAKVEKIESVLKAQLTDMSPIKKIESPISSSTYTVSSSHSLKEEGLSSIDSNQLVGHQSCLPKLFFTEWFVLDNVNNSNNLEKNNIQGDQSSLYNSQDVTPIYNMDLEEVGFAQGIQYKEGTSSNNELYNGEGSDTFDPQLNFEDKTQQNGWDDLFYGNYADILDELLMIDNLTYPEELNYN